MTRAITLDWFIGFVEGEGCWTWLGKWNNTTRNGKRVYYRRGQPQFLIAQNGRQVLDEIAEWLIGQGITARVWPKMRNLANDPRAAYELRVVGYGNARRLCALFDESGLRVDFKREQFERWALQVYAQDRRGPVRDDEIMGEVQP